MAKCPNIRLPEWNQLVASRGEDLAYFLWDQYDGDVPVQEYSSPTGANSITPKVYELLDKMGVEVSNLEDYVKDNPAIDFKGVRAIADVTAKIIAVSNNATNEEVTEEMVHVATEILEKTDPQLVTQMISKIGDLPIYKETFELYKDNPVYQLPNGRPNIRKIKKEAADKLIAKIVQQELNEESAAENEVPAQTVGFFRNMWNKITDWFRMFYKKSGVDIFREVGKKIVSGEIDGEYVDTAMLDVDEVGQANIYFSISDQQAAIQRKILNTKNNVRKVVDENEKVTPPLQGEEDANNYYEALIDGVYKRVKKRVTDRVKAWYRSKFRGTSFTPQQVKDNEVKRQLGTEFHEMFEEIHARFFNSDGTKRVTPGPAPNIKDSKRAAVYTKLEKYYTDLIQEFSKDGKNPLVFSEAIMYDPINDEAGTVDLLIVEEDGTANIYDWKFMSIAPGAKDVAWFKQGAYGVQLGQYKKMLLENYGVKKIGKNRAIPIQLKLKRDRFQDPTSDLKLDAIAIGSVNPTQLEDLTLTPVSEKTESTGIESLDRLIKKLNAVYTQVEKTRPTDELDRSSKRDRLNILKLAIRQAQVNQNIAPLIDAVNIIQSEGENIIAEYETTYKDRPPTDQSFEDGQLSDFADQIRTYLDTVTAFDRIATDIAPIIEGSDLTREEKDKYMTEISKKQTSIQQSNDKINELAGVFADKFMGLRNSVTGLTSPQSVLKGIMGLFRSAAELPLPSVRILTRLARKAQIKAQAGALVDVNRLLAIRKKLEKRGGNLLQTVQKLYQRDTKGGLVNKLIYRYQKTFYEEVDRNAEEGNRSKRWIKENVDVVAYQKEADKIIAKEIEKYNNIYDNDKALRDKLISDMKKKWDLSNPQFNGFNNYVIKRHPLPKWETKEYLEIKGDPELFELYNFLQDMNEKARDMGYLQNKIASTFLPYVRKGFAESMAWNFGLSAMKNFGARLERRADDVGYGSINEITGEVENAIPIYYTRDFSQNEDGTYDDSDVSFEFFKNQILYIQHMNKYKYMSEIEGQVNLMRTVVRAKNHYKTGWFGKPVQRGGEFVVDTGNEDNSRFFDLFVQNIMYDNPYPADGQDFGVPTAGIKRGINAISKQITGKELFGEIDQGSNLSIIKFMEVLNNAFQAKTLGLEPISGFVNLFGANLQMAAQSGVYYSFREFIKNEQKLIGNKFANNDERKAFVQLMEIFMPLKDSPTYEALQKSGLTRGSLIADNFQDYLFVAFRQPELHLERSLFLTLLENSMIVDGKIVNIRQYVKDKYKGRYNNPRQYRTLERKINSEINQLKKTRSMAVTKRLNKEGKVEIPGLDLSENNRDELQRLTNLSRTIARSATGGFTEFDQMKANLNIWTKSMMVFKGWIPKLADTRFGEFRKVGDDFNVRVDENGLTTGERYDIGRARLFFGNFMAFGVIPNINKAIRVIKATEQGIKDMDKMFVEYAQQYEARTGEKLNMSRDDFYDLVRVNLQKTLQEVALIAVLLGMLQVTGFLEPAEDEDKATRNRFRFYRKVLRRFTDELLFFYNPAEWSGVLRGGIIPSLNLLSEFGKFMEHFGEEVTGIDFSDLDKSPADVREDALPVKYLMKMFPVSKSLVTWLAIFDPEWAEEMDVTIQESNRR